MALTREASLEYDGTERDLTRVAHHETDAAPIGLARFWAGHRSAHNMGYQIGLKMRP